MPRPDPAADRRTCRVALGAMDDEVIGHRPHLRLRVTAITAFQSLFLERGPPSAIRSDNGVPFASPNELSVWWLRPGIAIERIKPGHPEQNGRHQRMHLTLKKEATRPAGMNSLQQQARFDAFVSEFNN